MELIRITHKNLATEHICCAISNEKDCQVRSKKDWLRERLDDGLVFLKGNVRGKCFIEYLPAENAWAPIEAEGYLYIDCLWVSGQFKGHGYANELLNACIADAKENGKRGLVALSSPKKTAFLSDPDYLAHRGFVTADEAPPYFRLMYLPLTDAAPPRFKEHVKAGAPEERGYTVYYTSQCPFTAKYVPLLAEAANARNVPLKTVHIRSAREAQSAPCPFTTFSLYRDGKFLTHEILSEKKFASILEANV